MPAGFWYNMRHENREQPSVDVDDAIYGNLLKGNAK